MPIPWNDFAGIQFAGQGRPEAIFSEFARSSPKRYIFSRAKDVNRDVNIERMAGKAARGAGIRFSRRGLHMARPGICRLSGEA